MKRFFQVLGYVSTYIFYTLIHNTQRAFTVLFDAVSELGGLYVKLIQFVCLRTDIFDNQKKLRLLSFYDSVPVAHLDVGAILTRELSAGSLARFASVDTKPFASGTFGQVYRATLTDGAQVVVKVLRPGIRMKLAVDFISLKIGAFLFNVFYEQHVIDVNGLLHEFEEMTYKELDYRAEARNAEYFYNAYLGHPFVVVPKTYSELSGARILVQEYIGGIALTDFMHDRLGNVGKIQPFSDGEFRTFCRRLAFELGIQGLTQEIFYADPHPGNIKLLPGNRFAFIDFGIVGVSPKNRRTYYHILELMVAHSEELNMNHIGKEFLQWGAGDFYRSVKTVDADATDKGHQLGQMITDKYAALLETYRERFRQIEAVEEENFAKMYLEIIQAGELLGVKIPEGMLASMRTVAIYKSWVTAIDPDYHFMRDVYREVLSSVNKKYMYNEDELTPKPMVVEDAIEGVLEWIGRVAEKDVSWYRVISREVEHLYA